MEEEEGGGASDTAPMLPRGPPDHQASALPCPGWPGPLLLPGRLVAGLLLHLLLPATAFLLVLLPAAAVVYLGFLCHSRVSLCPMGGGLAGVLGSGRALRLKATVLLSSIAPCPRRHMCPYLAAPSSPKHPHQPQPKKGFCFSPKGQLCPLPEASRPCTRGHQGLDSWVGVGRERGSRKRR